MKRYISLLLCLLAFAAVYAQDSPAQQFGGQRQAQQRPFFGQRQPVQTQPNRSGTFSPAEYWKQQQEFFSKEAGLTASEAEKFFPLYNELQQKKRELNRSVRQQTRQNGPGMTEEQAAKAIEAMAESKIKIAQLEKESLEKFKDILPASKILKIQNAEEQFNSKMLKDIQQSRGHQFQMNQPHLQQFQQGQRAVDPSQEGHHGRAVHRVLQGHQPRL